MAFSTSLAAAHAAPPLSGFVTRAGTPEHYYVNEEEVRCIPGKTLLRTLKQDHGAEERTECRQWVMGEQLTINGAHDKKSGVFTADLVEVDQPIPLAVNGFSLVDRILQPVIGSTGVLRADTVEMPNRTQYAYRVLGTTWR